MPPEPSAKADLRRQAELRRAEAHLLHGAQAGAAIARQFLTSLPWQSHVAVSGYMPMGDEADVTPLMLALAERGRQLLLPVVPGRATRLLFRRWQPGQPLEAGPFGTVHPPPDSEGAEPELLLVPLLAFDRLGHRLGYGGGYYDRTLAELRHRHRVVAVGIGFEAQYFPPLPSEGHDQRLNFMVTEQGVREFDH